MIQVDMFEVQLGASLLLQFRTLQGKVVRVLADGGVGARPPDHVHKKLRSAFKQFSDRGRRLDLIIGTHYDADHLDGLVPIIQDPDIEIGEVWLPPVANDSELHPFDEPIAENNLLALQLSTDQGRHVLHNYLQTKYRVCSQLAVPRDRKNRELAYSEFRFPDEDSFESALGQTERVFRQYREEALQVLGMTQSSHCDDNRFEPRDHKKLVDMIGWNHRFYEWWANSINGFDEGKNLDAIFQSIGPTSVANHNLAWIRKSAADDAINALSLSRVVEALRSRTSRVPIACQIVPNGRPRRFAWRNHSERFEATRRLTAQGPEIMLLGPSEGLVEKHRNRLPLGIYAAFAYLAHMPIKSITPSNQLSYVVRFTAEKQHILVTGDAGCVDFKPDGAKKYYHDLLATLRRLHVIQVAHHAGNNAHFYRVLSAAGYGRQSDNSYLLVSHATADPHRPSREFSLFLEELRRDDKRVRVLFTSRPREDKVREFISMIYPAIDEPSNCGDVRLLFDRKRWHVKKHAINFKNGPSPKAKPASLASK